MVAVSSMCWFLYK